MSRLVRTPARKLRAGDRIVRLFGRPEEDGRVDGIPRGGRLRDATVELVLLSDRDNKKTQDPTQAHRVLARVRVEDPGTWWVIGFDATVTLLVEEQRGEG